MEEHSLVGEPIGNYRIVVEINSGAFGSVYRAEHVYLKDRVVAIKLLHAYLNSSREREQFLQEAQFLASMNHPHILPLLDFGFHKSQPYLMISYAVGGSLRQLLKTRQLLPSERAVMFLVQVGNALQYAHQRHIIHRDLKPENILFDEQGHALLADFGIATMLSTASVKQLTTVGGTPSYMAPEQFQGQASKESDQYALGCMAYELFTGRPPFSAPDFVSMGFKHATEQPRSLRLFNPTIPVALEHVVLKAMAKQRSERYPDIASFLTALALAQRPDGRARDASEEAIPTVPSARSHPPFSAPTERVITQQEDLPVRPKYLSAWPNTISPGIEQTIKSQHAVLPRWKQILSFFFALFEGLLVLRFVLKILGSDPVNLFTGFVYALTDLVLFPFAGMFRSTSFHPDQALEWSTLVALLVYGGIFWIVLRLLRAPIFGRSRDA